MDSSQLVPALPSTAAAYATSSDALDNAGSPQLELKTQQPTHN